MHNLWKSREISAIDFTCYNILSFGVWKLMVYQVHIFQSFLPDSHNGGRSDIEDGHEWLLRGL